MKFAYVGTITHVLDRLYFEEEELQDFSILLGEKFKPTDLVTQQQVIELFVQYSRFVQENRQKWTMDETKRLMGSIYGVINRAFRS
jgi:hypothetical protein